MSSSKHFSNVEQSMYICTSLDDEPMLIAAKVIDYAANREMRMYHSSQILLRTERATNPGLLPE